VALRSSLIFSCNAKEKIMTHEYVIQMQGVITMHMALRLNSLWIAYAGTRRLHLRTARRCGESEEIKENVQKNSSSAGALTRHTVRTS